MGPSRAGSATYEICFRLPILNPNPKTDPNPNPKNNRKRKADVIHTAGRVYKKVSNDAHARPCANSNPNPNPNLTLAVYHASFVYTYGRPCV